MNTIKQDIRILTFFLICIFCLSINVGFAASNWYVDKDANGSNNGTSWENGWQSFGAIDWASVSPGDTIYISGGPSGTKKTYRERLSVGKSGNQNAPITITVGKEPSHNGTAILVGGSNYYYAVDINGKDWVTIDGQSGNDGRRHIEITQENSCSTCATVGVMVRGDSKGISMKYMYLHDVGGTSNDYDCAIKIVSSSRHDHEIAYNYIEKVIDAIVIYGDPYSVSSYGANSVHNNYISFYDDGVQASISTDIANNEFVRGPYVGKGHPDGIQIYGRYARIYNNSFKKFLDRPTGNAVIYIEPDGGNNMNNTGNAPGYYQIYNNVLYETGTASSLAAIMLGWSDPDWNSLRDVYILNNTIKGAFSAAIVDGWGGTRLDKNDVKNFYIMNNLFYSASNGGPMLALSTPSYSSQRVDYGKKDSGSSIVVDHNLYSGIGASEVSYNSVWHSYNAWKQMTGVQAVDVVTAPSLDSNLKPNDASDQIVGAGFAWSSIFDNDKDDNLRDSNSWTMGAYEVNTASGNPPLIAAPKNLRIAE